MVMSVGTYNSAIADKEVLDESHFIHLGLAHAMFTTTIYEEVGISGPKGHTLFHVNADYR